MHKCITGDAGALATAPTTVVDADGMHNGITTQPFVWRSQKSTRMGGRGGAPLVRKVSPRKGVGGALV